MIKRAANTVQVHIATYSEEYSDYKFLILKRSQKEKIYPGIWQVITGTMNDNETAIETALRETKEEIGLEPIKIWTIPYISQFFSVKTNTIHSAPVFGMLIKENDKIKLSDEHDNYLWLHLDLALEKLVLPSHREACKIFYEYILLTELGDIFQI